MFEMWSAQVAALARGRCANAPTTAARSRRREVAALAAGAELGAGDGDGGRNQPAIDALMRLPGVNATNYRAVVREVDSLAELATLPERRLATLIGTANAAQLHRFLHEAPPAE